jgi:hypothetical protein
MGKRKDLGATEIAKAAEFGRPQSTGCWKPV